MRAIGGRGLGARRGVTGECETGQSGQATGGFHVDSTRSKAKSTGSNERSEEFRVFHNNIIPWSKDEYDCLEYRVA